MAALDFPDSPTVGQVFDKWTWNGTMWVLTPGTGAGYVFVQDTAPTPRKVGDTWFDSSTGATGGTSWVAIEEGAVGSEKVWVQTSPGAGAPPAWAPCAAQGIITPGFVIRTNALALTFASSITSNVGLMWITPNLGAISVLNAGLYRATVVFTTNLATGSLASDFVLGALDHINTSGTMVSTSELLVAGPTRFGTVVANRLFQMGAGEWVRSTASRSAAMPADASVREGILTLERVG